jgi:selT/selW/selH-like putative selenoprotein
MQVRQYLEQHLDNVLVTLENYPPSPANQQLSRIVSAIQYTVIATALLADWVYTVPQSLREKKMMIVMGAWFLGNTINNGLTSTGAFEVFVDDSLAFSKLQSGRMPQTMEEIMSAVSRVLHRD